MNHEANSSSLLRERRTRKDFRRSFIYTSLRAARNRGAQVAEAQSRVGLFEQIPPTRSRITWPAFRDPCLNWKFKAFGCLDFSWPRAREERIIRSIFGEHARPLTLSVSRNTTETRHLTSAQEIASSAIFSFFFLRDEMCYNYLKFKILIDRPQSRIIRELIDVFTYVHKHKRADIISRREIKILTK